MSIAAAFVSAGCESFFPLLSLVSAFSLPVVLPGSGIVPVAEPSLLPCSNVGVGAVVSPDAAGVAAPLFPLPLLLGSNLSAFRIGVHAAKCAGVHAQKVILPLAGGCPFSVSVAPAVPLPVLMSYSFSRCQPVTCHFPGVFSVCAKMTTLKSSGFVIGLTGSAIMSSLLPEAPGSPRDAP